MELEIQQIPIEDKFVLRNLMELCQHDYSEFNGDDVGDYGLFGYRYIDHYWTESGRHPFLIRVEGKLAGFALVSQVASDSGQVTNSISEFFILRKYRRKGIGREVARRIFSMFPGRWNVGQESGNDPAQAFWRETIAEYTRGKFKEVQGEKGPLQVFEVPS